MIVHSQHVSVVTILVKHNAKLCCVFPVTHQFVGSDNRRDRSAGSRSVSPEKKALFCQRLLLKHHKRYGCVLRKRSGVAAFGPRQVDEHYQSNRTVLGPRLRVERDLHARQFERLAQINVCFRQDEFFFVKTSHRPTHKEADVEPISIQRITRFRTRTIFVFAQTVRSPDAVDCKALPSKEHCKKQPAPSHSVSKTTSYQQKEMRERVNRSLMLCVWRTSLF